MGDGKLSGQVGKLYKAAEGTQVVGDGTTPIATAGWHRVDAKGGSTIFTVDVGYWEYLTTSDTPAVGDKCTPITLSSMSFVKNWNVAASKGEEDVTTQDESVKDYLPLRVDMQGSMDGIAKNNDSVLDSVYAKFVPVIEDDGAGSITVTAQNDDAIIFFGYFNETSTTDETEMIFIGKVNILGFDQAVPVEGAQAISGINFRVRGDSKPAIYKRTIV